MPYLPRDQRTRLPRLRQIVRKFHLWLGLTAGLLFVLLGLTGSALVFYVELDDTLHPIARNEPASPAPGWESPVWDTALATGRAHYPYGGGSWNLEVTHHGGPIPARYYYPADGAQHGSHHGAGRDMVWFSADGTRILRSQPWGGYLMSWLYRLHMDLLLGDPGMQIVGWAGVVILLLLLSGIAAWWPRGSWRKALAFKRPAGRLRRLRDLHKHFGLWSAGLLVLLAATGALLALPDIKAALFTATIATPDPVPSPISTAASGQQVSIAQALATARWALPDARLAFINVPDGGSDPIRIRVQVPGDPHARFPGSSIYLDQYSGEVLAVHDIRRGNAATSVNAWIRVLHDGSVGGLATRILAVLLGLVPAALFITGLLHWRQRHRAANPIEQDC
ncbi:hypothetical protein PK98_01990 [Croceibacterium mercuriale]|uniref:PepSY domain-containing protein n=1 Tax=Croceibacterium mercuriale TaxID=1572751 RepID=A0A0B2C0F9_9SPHN|nr:PepSY-associated TM helix domain-containing protein [Croceibacterium mercuriale]KHL25486.1 hypothetical protein PK98_01990 [Croceibacterium mercuriale]